MKHRRPRAAQNKDVIPLIADQVFQPAVVHAPRTDWTTIFHAKKPAQMAKMKAHSKIEPSSEDHSDTIVNVSAW